MSLRPEQPVPLRSNTAPGKGYWITAATLSAATASLLVAATATFLNSQHAYWAKVTILTDAAQPPPLSLQYGLAPQDSAAIQWQPYSQTILTLRRQDSSNPFPVRIEQSAADGKAIDPAALVIQGGTHEALSLSLADHSGGMVRWHRTATHFDRFG